MDSSAQAISHQNLETASAFQTETITGSHLFKVYGYSLIKGIGIRNYINSIVFTVGGYKWKILFYLDGVTMGEKNYLSIFVRLESEATVVKARPTFTILRQDGAPSKLSYTGSLRTYKSTCNTGGYNKFAKITEFETSKYLKDDAFTVKCTVTVIKGTKLEVINSHSIIIPPSNLHQNWTSLLESGIGADVTFVVNKERIKAHRCILAARSVVFNAEFFGFMKEKWMKIITVKDIEAPVFKSMLYFIYSDSLPDLEGPSDDECEKKDLRFMAQHLLVAADRYQLERLRLICENLLCKNLDVNNAATTLILAEQHNCTQLKAQCLEFMSIPEIFKAMAQTYEFQNLMKICPSILKNI